MYTIKKGNYKIWLIIKGIVSSLVIEIILKR